jgi:hypothetical protein
MALPAINNLSTTLSAPVGLSDTTINVASASAWPATGVFSIELEAIAYSGKTGVSFTGCTRAYDGTTAATHAVLLPSSQPNPVELRVIARHINEIHTELDSLSPSFSLAYNAAVNNDVFTVPTGYVLDEVRVLVQTAYDGTGPTITVGTAGMPTQIFAATDINLAAAGVWTTTFAAIAGPYTVRVVNTEGAGATQGQLLLILKLSPPVGG